MASGQQINVYSYANYMRGNSWNGYYESAQPQYYYISKQPQYMIEQPQTFQIPTHVIDAVKLTRPMVPHPAPPPHITPSISPKQAIIIRPDVQQENYLNNRVSIVSSMKNASGEYYNNLSVPNDYIQSYSMENQKIAGRKITGSAHNQAVKIPSNTGVQYYRYQVIATTLQPKTFNDARIGHQNSIYPINGATKISVSDSKANRIFLDCCKKKNVDHRCESRCNFDVLSKKVLTGMFLGSDPCPQSYGRDLMSCAAQNKDHTPCCQSQGVDKTTAGPKCLKFCQMLPAANFQPDVSYLPCWGVLKKIKQCFKEALITQL